MTWHLRRRYRNDNSRNSTSREKEHQTGRYLDQAYRERAVQRLASSLTVEGLETLVYDPNSVSELIGPAAVGDSSADLVFTPVVPCRVIDTRVAGGIMAANTTRSFLVAGTAGFPTQGGLSGGCGVPTGATAAVLNVVAVTPSGPGNLRAFAYDEPQPATPLAAILNFGAVPALSAIANGTIVPLCDPVTMTCGFDIIIYAGNSNVHVVVDVAGYFQSFPVADITSIVLANDGAGSGLDADLFDGMDSSAYQMRVSGTCPPGESIRVINSDGTVNCEVDTDTDTDTTYTAGTGLTLSGNTFDADTSYLQRRVSTACGTGQAIRSISATGVPTCQPGILIDQLVSNATGPTATGFFEVRADYTPSVDTRAFVFARCTVDGTNNGQAMAFRAAVRVGVTVTLGSNLDYNVHTPDKNTNIFQSNQDFFDLTAGQTYDFGVNFTQIPPTATGADHCSVMVQLFTR